MMSFFISTAISPLSLARLGSSPQGEPLVRRSIPCLPLRGGGRPQGLTERWLLAPASRIGTSLRLPRVFQTLAMTDLAAQSLFCHCEEPRRGDVAIFWQFITIKRRLVHLIGSPRLPQSLRSFAMTNLAVQSLLCHCEEPRRGDVAIFWQFITVKRRLVHLTGSLRLPRLLRSLAMTGGRRKACRKVRKAGLGRTPCCSIAESFVVS